MELKTISTIKIIALFFLAFLSLCSCDPCREYAEKVCACKIGENEKRECLAQLQLAQRHKNFEKALNPDTCKKALKSCSCSKINSGNLEECGFFRK